MMPSDSNCRTGQFIEGGSLLAKVLYRKLYEVWENNSVILYSPGPVGSVSQPNRVLHKNFEAFKNLLNPVGMVSV